MFKNSAYDLDFSDKQPSFKLELTTNDDINVLIGNNGAGKTMYLICTWFMIQIINSYKTSLIVSQSKADDLFSETANNIISMTFNNYKYMSGIFMFTGEVNNIEFQFILRVKNGKVEDFNIEMDNISKFASLGIPSALYNSSSARTFDSYERYLGSLELIGVEEFTDINQILKLKKMYKMYDILWFEMVKKSLKKWSILGVPPQVNEFILNFNNYYSSADSRGNKAKPGDITTKDFGENAMISIDGNIPGIKSDTLDQKFSELGKGHQAILMTHLFR